MKGSIKFLFIVVFVLFISNLAQAQIPETEVFLLELDQNESIKNISYLSSFNPHRYNNQAIFISDDEVLLTSQLDPEQTDIVKLNLRSKTWKRLTNTKESEYSPRMQGDAHFTTVRVEMDGITQVLWEYPLSLNHQGQRLLPEIENLGFYYLLPASKVALFVIEESMNLKIASLKNNTILDKSQHIGRCFQKKKTGELLFYQNSSLNENGSIKLYNITNKEVKPFAKALSGSEDFSLYGASEQIVMAKDASLYIYDQMNASWVLWLDLSSYGLNNITRIDIRENKILLVNHPQL